MMTVAALRSLLDGLADDTEVRLAVQPSYPFECAVASLNAVRPNQAEIDQVEEDISGGELTAEDLVEARAVLEEALRVPEVLYICQGSQIGYASAELWNS